MNILVVGGGGREHAIVNALKKSSRVSSIHAAPGNGGISQIAACHDVKATDIDGICALAAEINADYVFVAADDPLVAGMVDALNEKGFKTFGPRKNAAVLEGSKVFSKAFMKRHGIPTAEYESFSDPEKAINYIKSKNKFPTVIKCDGLALGKGVIIAEDCEAAEAAVREIMQSKKFGASGEEIVIEEYLEGPEITLLVFTDGKSVSLMPASTDHKRALDGDLGLNTGGMGVVTHPPYFTEAHGKEALEKVVLPTVKGMAAENRPFKGCLYCGLMLTADGVKVIEFNCRFGDPEAQAVLPLLETDLLQIMEAVHEERLSELEINWKNAVSACVVIASGGYPEKYQTGEIISGLDASYKDTVIFHAGTKADGKGGFITAGGRVLGVESTGETLQEALEKAYAAAEKISFKGSFYRKDIGKKALDYIKR